MPTFNSKIKGDTAKSMPNGMIQVQTLIEYANGEQIIVSSFLDDGENISTIDEETAVFRAEDGRIRTEDGASANLLRRVHGTADHSFWVLAAISVDSTEQFEEMYRPVVQ